MRTRSAEPFRTHFPNAVEEGDQADLAVRSHHFTVSAESPVTVRLVGQGPELDGKPAVQSGDRRLDGSLITATVPQARPVRRRTIR
jgi:alpha,alpha-trehalose phosphorylase